MSIKYIGRTTDFCGKTLWEIVGNLKNLGVGRLVKRNMFERYPEPSFFRIVKVDTVENEEIRKARVWVEKVFRGKRYPKLIELYSASYKPDYILVPKEEEKHLWDRVEKTKINEKVLPQTIPFPPLLKLLIEKEAAHSGTPISGEPRLKLRIKSGVDNNYKIADDETPPTITVKPLHEREIKL